MAQISPNIGVPQVAPDATPGNDYQNVRATPEQTGGLIAQGLDRFGAGATKAGDFFGEVQTDDASNNYQKAASELTEHFKTLNGADALNAQEDTKKQLDDLYRAARSGLTRPDQQLKFDSQNRPYTDRYILGQISTHAVQQGQTFALKTNADATDVAHNMAATAGSMGDEKTLAVARAKALDAQAKTLQTMGQENDPNAQAAAISKANLVYKTYAETMAASGPQGALKAQQFLERPEIVKALGDNYAEVYSRTRAQADQAKADNLASAPLPPSAVQPRVPGQTFFIGDSIADGLKTAAKGEGHTQVGASPVAVQNAIANTDPADLRGKQIVLSSGASNDPKNVSMVESQIDTLKAKGVNPADIKVVGVGDRADFAGVNEKLATIAKEKGATFTGALDPGNLSADRVHPANYGAVSTGQTGFQSNLAQATKELNLTPQEQFLYKMHLGNLTSAGGVDNADGSRSSLLQTTVEVNGKTYNLPTVWGGKIHPESEALPHAKEVGLDKFPSYGSEEEAEARYQKMHDYMDRDTGSYLTSRRAQASSVTPAPIFAQAAAANPAGFSAAGLARTAQIESGGKANAVNGSMHGMFQFSPGTWASFGHGSPYDVTASTEAAQKYAAANSAALTNVLGRKPTDAELYVAHQQGLGGATALFTHPNEPAVDVLTPVYGGNRAIAEKAIRGNGGDPNAPASAFVNLWTGKFNGAKGATPFVPAGGQTMTMPAAGLPAALPPEQEPEPLRATQPSEDAVYHPEDAAMQPVAPPSPEDTATAIRAARVRMIEEADASPEVKQRAVAKVNEVFQAAMIAAQVDKKAKDEQNNQAANDYTTEMMKGPSPDIVGRIANDKRITSFETRKALWDLALKSSGENNPAVYGKGFNDVYQRIVKSPGDPDRISDPTEILKMGAGDTPALTFAGTQKALTLLNESRKSVDGAGLNVTKAGAYANAKKYLSFEEDTGFGIKIRDPEGEKLFNGKFTKMFESAFDDWTVKQGKNPYDFPLFEDKKMDEFLQKIRPKSQRDADRLAALGETPQVAETPNAPLPPAPGGVDPQGWQRVVATPPPSANGAAPFTHAAWASALQMLAADPEKNAAAFDSSKFGRAGYRAAEILKELNVKRGNAAREPNEAPPRPTPVPEVTSLPGPL